MIPAPAIAELKALVGERSLLTDPGDLRLYEYDGGVDKHMPEVVIFPRSTEHVSGIVKISL